MNADERGLVTAGPRIALGAVVLWTAVLSGFVLIGADLMWAVALGDAIRDTGHVPSQLPSLVAPQVEWENPVVLAELLLSWVNSWGWAGLPTMHLVLVAVTLTAVVIDGHRAGASDARLAVAVSLVAVGAAATFVVVRFPMLSLVPFVVMVALLRTWDRGRGRAIWWVPPLVIVWGNLHGAVLVGLAVLVVFVLAAGRKGLGIRVAAGLLSLLGLVLTPAGVRTPEYYLNALGNEAAVRGTDLWARPALDNPLDVAMLVSALILVAMAARSLRLWEWIVVVGLALGTASAARHGVWLLLFIAPIAGVRPSGRALLTVAWARPTPRAVASGIVLVTLLPVIVGVQFGRRSAELQPSGQQLVPELKVIAGDGTVLALEPEAETFAQQGIRVWAANPIDAFAQPTQAAFLDFLHDCTVPPATVDVVVVDQRCADRVTEQGWSVRHRAGDLTVLTQ